ncbi:hypothetical protein BH11ARM1_BH11ARM1_07630 [soil metagenome]
MSNIEELISQPRKTTVLEQIKHRHNLTDMGSTELAANLFRATQTEEKLRRDGIKGKAAANQTHKVVGAKVRQTIKELGGTMPESLPAEESIKAVERRFKKQQQLETGEGSEGGEE